MMMLVTTINWRDGGVSRLWWGTSGMRRQVFEVREVDAGRRSQNHQLTLDAARVRGPTHLGFIALLKNSVTGSMIWWDVEASSRL